MTSKAFKEAVDQAILLPGLSKDDQKYLVAVQDLIKKEEVTEFSDIDEYVDHVTDQWQLVDSKVVEVERPDLEEVDEKSVKYKVSDMVNNTMDQMLKDRERLAKMAEILKQETEARRNASLDCIKLCDTNLADLRKQLYANEKALRANPEEVERKELIDNIKKSMDHYEKLKKCAFKDVSQQTQMLNRASAFVTHCMESMQKVLDDMHYHTMQFGKGRKHDMEVAGTKIAETYTQTKKGTWDAGVWLATGLTAGAVATGTGVSFVATKAYENLVFAGTQLVRGGTHLFKIATGAYTRELIAELQKTVVELKAEVLELKATQSKVASVSDAGKEVINQIRDAKGDKKAPMSKEAAALLVQKNYRGKHARDKVKVMKSDLLGEKNKSEGKEMDNDSDLGQGLGK